MIYLLDEGRTSGGFGVADAAGWIELFGSLEGSARLLRQALPF